MTPQYKRIRLLARCTRYLLSLVLAGGTLFWAVLSWIAFRAQFAGTPLADGDGNASMHLFAAADGQLLAAHPMLFFAYFTLVLGATAYGLLRLWQLMRLYEAGIVFDRQASGHLSAFALCMLLRELLDSVGTPLIVGALADGQHAPRLTLGSGTLHVLLITLLLLLVSRIMAAAHVIDDDNRQII